MNADMLLPLLFFIGGALVGALIAVAVIVCSVCRAYFAAHPEEVYSQRDLDRARRRYDAE